MEQTDHDEQTFPEGFQHVEERLNETTEHLKQIDDQIKNIPKEQGPKLIYHPPNYVGGIVPGSRDKTRIALQQKQHEIRVDTLAKTEADTRGANTKAGRVVRDKVREKLFPNPYRQLSQEDRLDGRNAPKELEQSQDYMDAELVARAAARKEATRPVKQTNKTKDKSVTSMSARFMQSLSYDNQTSGKSDRSPDKDRD